MTPSANANGQPVGAVVLGIVGLEKMEHIIAQIAIMTRIRELTTDDTN